MNRLLAILTVLLLAGACNIDSLNDPVVVPEVNDEFYLDMWERLEADGRYLEWKLRTIENADCEDAALDYDYTTTGGTVQLAINAIDNPADCTPSEQPLNAVIEGVKFSNGYYPLSFSLRDAVTNEGTMVISDSKYRVDFKDPSGLVLLRKELRRIPDDVIWGYVKAEQDSLEEAASQFIMELEEMSQPTTLVDGYYGYFTVSDGNKLNYTNSQAPSGATPVIYKYTQDNSVLTDLAETFRQQYPNGLEIKIFNTRGEEL